MKVMKEQLIEKFKSQSAVLGVIGLGYVGLPFILETTRSGFKTIGFDIDPVKVEKLQHGESYIHHIPSSMIQTLRDGGMFEATTDYTRLREADAIIICVPTPLNEYREPDLSAVDATAAAIAANLRAGQLIVLESTTYPGTTEERIRPRLEATGMKVGLDVFLAYSPEREDPGRKDYSTRTIPKVFGGCTPTCLEAGTALYRQLFDRVIPVSSTQAAEMTKLLENIYRAVNIALVNELKMLCDRMRLDVWEVIEAASSKPFGYQPFYPGPGLGGHCIPIDPFYLTWKAREVEFSTRFIELAGEINTGMPRYVVMKVVEALTGKGLAVKGARILVLGVAYKKDVDDVRESPALKVVELLREWGMEVQYHDPYVPRYPKGRRGDLGLASIPLTEAALREHDAVLILTDHSCVDYQWVADHADLVVDTRNATRHVKNARGQIVKA
ncbi:MAG TPA: nucleotide sugar dehydrogenase [bacterium]|nr:nucleotide sugar dehydrogenase [bacterium]HOL93748.1 nucleotide sugar dehydrogenase [bacterium]HPP01269.1 nucleotide sugar dehydrogenase [bacterium]HXK95935.1 nucleotide sugar dehydrogenase [bacterium]